MKRLQVIPNGPPKSGSDLLVPDWAKPEPLRVRVKPEQPAPAIHAVDGTIAEIPADLPLKLVGVLVLTLTIAISVVLPVVRYMLL